MKKINTKSKITITFSDGEKITATAGMLNQVVIWANESAIYNILDNKGLYD